MKQYTYASLSLLVTAYILTLGSSVQAAYTDAGRTQDVVVKTDAATAAARSESLETTIISKRDIENKAAKSVEEVIFSEPGMVRTVDAMGRVTLSMRGAEPRHTLLLVDGQPVLGNVDKYNGAGDELQRLGTDNVERIEVIQGAASAKYGADAMGGVVNIITKKAAKKAAFTVRAENRKAAASDGSLYGNYFLRADSGSTGKGRLALYAGRRTIAPIYSEKVFRGAINYAGDFRTSLRYYGDIKNTGLLVSYAPAKDKVLHMAADTVREDMKRFVKHRDDSPEPVVLYTRNINRNTYAVQYEDRSRGKTQWQIEMQYAKLHEADTAIGSKAAFSPFEGKNTLVYLDTLQHTQGTIKVAAQTQINASHLLSWGGGYTREEGEGARLSDAPVTHAVTIDPWEYDKNLYTEKGVGKPASNIHDWPFYKDKSGHMGVDLVYDQYGYRQGTRSLAPAYTYDDYTKEKEDENEDPTVQAQRDKRKAAFAEELRRENGKRNKAILEKDEYGEWDWDDDTMVRRYYAFHPEGLEAGAFPLTWHGKTFMEEHNKRDNQLTIGKAALTKHYIFLSDLRQIGTGTTVMSSVRRDQSSLFGSHFSFNIGLTRALDSDGHTRIKANVGTAYAEPGMGELYYNWEMYGGTPYDLGVGKLGFYWLGNPYLKPETSLNFDVAWEKETPHTEARINVFHHRIKNYMSVYFTGQLLHFRKQDVHTWLMPPDMLYSFKNLGQAHITGVELSLAHRFLHHWRAKLGYTYVQAINESDPDMPKRLLNKPMHKVDVSLGYEHNGWKATLWGDYYVHMLDSNTVSHDGNYVELTDEFHRSPEGYRRERLVEEATVPDPRHAGKRGYQELEYTFSSKKLQTYKDKTFGIWNLLIQKRLNPAAAVYMGIDNLFDHRDDAQAMSARTYKVGARFSLDGGEVRTKTARKTNGTSGRPASASSGSWFIGQPALPQRAGVQVHGAYAVRWQAFTGKDKPEGVRVTTQATVGSAYKNYAEKGGHGFAQRLSVEATAKLGRRSYVTLAGSADGMPGSDTAYDTSDSRGLNVQHVDTAALTRRDNTWDIAVGRLQEPLGLSGYWFRQTFDGVRIVRTGKGTQVRVGYGDFSQQTGIKDSAYSRALWGTFYRPPTKAEWLGIQPLNASASERYQNGAVYTKDYGSLYAALVKAGNFAEEYKIFKQYKAVMDAYGDEQYQKNTKSALATLGQYEVNTYMWEKITLTDAQGKKQTFLAAVIPQATGDKASIEDIQTMRKWGQTAFETTENKIKQTPLNGSCSISQSGIIKPGKYQIQTEFYGYGLYKGKDVLQDLGITYMGKRGGIAFDKVRKEEFQTISRREALEKARTSLYDRTTAWEKVQAVQHEQPVYGWEKATISPVMKSVLLRLAGPEGWKPENDSSMPLQCLGKLGYHLRQDGMILQQDAVPSLQRAVFVQLKRQVNRHWGWQVWGLHSVGDAMYTTSSVQAGRVVPRTFRTRAAVIGLGIQVKVLPQVTVSAEAGQNYTALARYLNGSTVYDHPEHSNVFTVKGHTDGNAPYFMVYRLDCGAYDRRRPGSWHMFLDYKYFQHGAFFGGNGTESVPDRYLDGVSCFTVGSDYAVKKNLSLAAYYTFGVKGIHERDSLYGPERFTLGDYLRVQGTYHF